jgi:hypothetical protein
VAMPRGLSGANHGDPTGCRPQWIYCPTAISSLTAILVVTASSVWESVSADLQATFRPTWTRYSYFKPPLQHQNPDFAFKIASDL